MPKNYSKESREKAVCLVRDHVDALQTSYVNFLSGANRCLDQVRRRVQNEQTGHRGRRDDPLYRIRRSLLVGEERLNPKAAQRLSSLLALGDPKAEVAVAYRVKERLREFYRCTDIATARTMLRDLIEHCRRPAMPPELQKLGKTLHAWFDKICNYHLARVSNGPTEAINNLIKRICQRRAKFDPLAPIEN